MRLKKNYTGSTGSVHVKQSIGIVCGKIPIQTLPTINGSLILFHTIWIYLNDVVSGREPATVSVCRAVKGDILHFS